jgi:hypothetical protein
MDLNIAAEHANCIPGNGIVEAVHQAVIPHHHGEGESHRQYDDYGAATVPPDVAPCEAQVKCHYFFLSMIRL